MVLSNACLLIATGLAIGGVGAWYLSASAKTFLYELEPNDVRAFVAAGLSLSLAAIVPARPGEACGKRRADRGAAGRITQNAEC